MAASVSVQYTGIVQVTETLATALSSAPVIVFDTLNKTNTYGSASTPAVSKDAVNSIAMTTGAVTLDLTNMAGTNGVIVNGNSFKIQMVKFQNPSVNPITIKNGASNGYLLGGVAWSITIPSGGEFQMYLANVSQTISGTTKNIDISGTGSDSLNYIIVMG